MNNSIARTAKRSPRDRARSTLATLSDIGPVTMAHSLRTSTADFQADVIHSALGGVRVMKLVLALSRHLELPIVPHFMDDWPSTLFADGQLGGVARSEAVRALSKIMERSPVCLTIGDDMRDEFEQRFGRPCVTVGNSVNLDDFAVVHARQLRSDGRLTLRYVGGLHLGRHVAVAAVARAITSLRGPADWLIEIFAPDADRARATELERSFDCVKFCGSVSPDAVPAILTAADALLFLESNVPEVLNFTRLSVSTKVPQYLASGRPVLVFGPDEQSSVRVLRSAPSTTFVSSTANTTEIEKALTRLTAATAGSGSHTSAGLPDWFDATFSETATHDRLHAALTAAVNS